MANLSAPSSFGTHHGCFLPPPCVYVCAQPPDQSAFLLIVPSGEEFRAVFPPASPFLWRSFSETPRALMRNGGGKGLFLLCGPGGERVKRIRWRDSRRASSSCQEVLSLFCYLCERVGREIIGEFVRSSFPPLFPPAASTQQAMYRLPEPDPP